MKILGFLAVIGTYILGSCTQSSNQGSQTKHENAAPINGHQDWLYHDISDEEYQLTLHKEDHLLPHDHPMVAYLNRWIEKFHANVLQIKPEAENIPMPRVIISQNPRVNAFVAPVQICIKNAYLDLGLEQTDAASTIQPAMIYKKALLASSGHCVEKTYGQSEILEMAQFHLGKDCQLTHREVDGKLFIKPDQATCDVDASILLQKNPRISFYATHNRITFFTGLLETMSEEEVIAILAHELGHYYRGHTVLKKLVDHYDYFYEIKDGYNRHRPLAGDSEISLILDRIYNSYLSYGIESTKSFYQLLKDDIPGIYPELRGLTLHGAIFHKLQLLAEDYTGCDVDPNNEDLSCQRSLCAPTYGNEPAYPDSVFDPSSFNPQLYSSLEADWLQCLSHIPAYKIRDHIFSKSYDGRIRDYLNPDETRKSQTGRALVLRLNQQLQANYPAYSASNIFNSYENIQQYMTRINDFDLTGLEAHLTEVVNQFKLGHYSTEQEADELASEWLADLGVDPDAAARAMLNFISDPGQREQCLTRMSQGWIDPASGEKIIEPIRKLEVHHDPCFRAFDIYHDVRAHGYESSRITFRPNPEWGQLIAALSAEDSDLSSSQLESERVSSARRDNFAKFGIGCSFEPEPSDWAIPVDVEKLLPKLKP